MANGQRKNFQYTTSYTSNGTTITGAKDTNTKNLLEGGIGYFKPIQDRGVFEIYGGGGLGNISFDRKDDPSGNSIDNYFAKTSRFFIQPSLGYTDDNFGFAFSLRYVRLKFYDADLSNYKDTRFFEQDLRDLENFTYTFVEPSATFRAGWDKIKFQLQGILSISTNSFIDYTPFVISLGIHFNLAPRYNIE